MSQVLTMQEAGAPPTHLGKVLSERCNRDAGTARDHASVCETSLRSPEATRLVGPGCERTPLGFGCIARQPRFERTHAGP